MQLLDLPKKRIVVLSTSMFTDRIILFSSFLNYYKTSNIELEVWSSSYPQNIDEYNKHCIKLVSFPIIVDFKERYNVLRKIVNKSTAYRLKMFSVLSMENFRNRDVFYRINFFTIFSKVIAFFKLNFFVERILLKILSHQTRSENAFIRLQSEKPDLLFVTNPFWSHESAIAIEAKKLGIKIVSLIPSWDNITTKSRFVFKSDAFAVWSNLRKSELLSHYPYTQNIPIGITGASQYDIFHDDIYIIPKKDFYNFHDLKSDLPIVLYVLGSPLFIKSEFETCAQFLREITQNGLIDKFQILIRPHPNKDNGDFIGYFESIHSNVRVQKTTQKGKSVLKRSQNVNDTKHWVSTFFYSSILINLSSTSMFDALYFNLPVININFDHTVGNKFDSYIKEINSKWTHLKHVYNSNSIKYVNSIKDMSNVLEYILSSDNTFLDNQKQLLMDICNNNDGLAGKRLFDFLLKQLD
jgi:hypothetical protein